MTEKRFTIEIDDENFAQILDTNIPIGQYNLCNIINQLHEENQRLKRQIYNLEHTRDFCAEDCERLEKENEELKSEIREVRGVYEELWMRFYDY